MIDPVENWRLSSRYDLKAAHAMLSAGHYSYVIFFCHMATEKMLKAVVEQQTQKTPPKTHNLRLLLSKIDLKPPKDALAFIGELSEVSAPTRYPLDILAASESYTEDVARKCLKKAQKVVKWIEASLARQRN